MQVIISAWVYLPRLLNTHSSDPYPFAVDEIFDAYRIIVESKGKAIGIGGDINIVLSGDSACVSMFSAGMPLPHLPLVEVAWPPDAL